MHTDPELLGLLALGEAVGTEDERLHAETCPECGGELAQLQHLVSVGRTAGHEIAMATPSPEVWARIRSELALDLPQEEVSTHKPGRSPLAVIKEAIAARTRDSDDHLKAHARLTPIESQWSFASGTAELSTDKRGRRLLEVDLHADLPETGVRQAWLVHRDDPTRRQTLGILDGPHGLWTVDHSIDLEEYAILDISQQHTGETEHSGQTVVRGAFTLVS